MKLQRQGISNVTFDQIDAQNGDMKKGLYDRIICDLVYPEIPRYLLECLVSGGAVVCAIGNPFEQQTLVRLTKIGSRFEREDLFPVRLGAFEDGIAKAM